MWGRAVRESGGSRDLCADEVALDGPTGQDPLIEVARYQVAGPRACRGARGAHATYLRALSDTNGIRERGGSVRGSSRSGCR